VRNTQENGKLQAQLEDQKKESVLAQQLSQELKQQVARLSEQLREKQRDLTREQELRSKLEASSRELKKAGGVAERPRSPLLRQAQGQPPARIGISKPRRPTDVAVLDEASPDGSLEGSNPARSPLADVTNSPIVSSGAKSKLAGASPICLANMSETTTKGEDKLQVLQTPTKFGEGDLGTREAGQNSLSRLNVLDNGAEEVHGSSDSLSVKSVLRKVPTNFTERSDALCAQRSASCPAVLRDTRIRFAAKLQEESSPPKWYLEGWYPNLDKESTGPGRGAVKVRSMESREISPRRKPVVEARKTPARANQDSEELARWR
jgi:hypothetical protein